MMPGMPSGLTTEVARYRSRLVGRALDIAARLDLARWWLVRPEPPVTFVLGDSPVAATISLGHDDE